MNFSSTNKINRNGISLSPGILSTEDVNIVCFDTMYRYLFFNKAHKEAVKKTWGVNISVGSSILDIIPESEKRTTLQHIFNRALNGETIIEIKECSDIEKHIWDSTYSPMINPKGEVIGVSVYSIDITGPINTKKSDQAKEKKIQYLFDNMTEGFALCEIICDENNIPFDYRILEVNKAYEEQTGIKGSEITGKTVLEFFPDIEKSWIEIYGEIALTQIPRTFTNYNHNTERYYETSAFSPEKGKFAILFRDTTDRNNIERKLSQAIEYAGSSIIITDKKGVIEYINPAFSKLTGYTAEEVIGTKTSLLKSGIHTDSFYGTLWTTITNNKAWQGKIIDKKKNGNLFPAVLNIAPILSEDGEITHFVASHSDISELEKMEEKLHQAQKMEAIGTLVGGIAHDFNNVLTGITGSAYLARKGANDAPHIQKYLTTIEKLAFRSANLIKQLITFARKDKISMSNLSLISIIKETFKLIRTTVPENINIQIKYCDEPLTISGDINQLNLILLNLINNACDAMEGVDNPEITIDLSLLNCDQNFIKNNPFFKFGRYAHISVSDIGCGIPENQKEHLFEPFFTTKDQGKGTGLGLSMVYGAVEMHQGLIELESIEGEGSTFHIYIPLLENDKPTTNSQENNKNIKGNGELILVVDDDEDILSLNSEILEVLGYKVLNATNGLEAIDIFTSHQAEIALIVMDVVMPKLSGVKAAEYIRKIKPDTKIIFATGYDKGEFHDKQLLNTSETILTKPFSIQAFSKAISNELSS